MYIPVTTLSWLEYFKILHTLKTMSDSDSEHLKRKREKIEEKEEENRKATKTSNALLAQLHAERNQRRPPIEKATPAAVEQNTMMMMSSVSTLKPGVVARQQSDAGCGGNE